MNWNRGLLRVAGAMVFLSVAALQLLGDVRETDVQLRTMAQEKLSRAKIGGQVTLKVENAMATLEGSVDSIGLKNRAGKEVERVSGIASVTNNLRVESGQNSDNAIAEEAAKRVRKYAYYTIFDDVELVADGGNLKLSGAVTQPWRRQEIESILSTVPGVKEVENNIEVLPLSPFDDQIRMRVAMAIYRDPALFRYGIRANPTIHIIVKNGNVTLTGIVGNQVDSALAERAARFATTFFGLENQLVVESELRKKTR